MAVDLSKLASCTVLDERKAVHRLADLWAKQTMVGVWVRHFGCMFCREQVGELREVVPEIHAAGAELVVIGNGSPEAIPGFRAASGYEGPLYTDPRRESYRAAGMKRGLYPSLKLVKNGLRALKHGFRQGKTEGDPFQQGGVLLIAPGGELRWSYISQQAGDHPTPAEILAALGKVSRHVAA
jgi:peroxiredoxin